VEINRRAFMSLAAAAAVGRAAGAAALETGHGIRFKAIVFDGFAVFNPGSVEALVESRFPGRGRALMEAWRSRQFEYQWLRALGGQYADFRKTTEDSLKFASVQLRLEMPDDTLQELLRVYKRPDAWPDVGGSLSALRSAGLRLAILSNMNHAMLVDGLERSALTGSFDAVISTDAIRSFKPDPRAYNLPVEALKLSREEILFVPFAGWDVAGARWFGYPTFWMNRSGAPLEYLGVKPDAVGADMKDLQAFVLG